jgi:hypothetical protein
LTDSISRLCKGRQWYALHEHHRKQQSSKQQSSKQPAGSICIPSRRSSPASRPSPAPAARGICWTLADSTR